MNQKIAPSGALCVGPVASAGMLPVPAPVGPWHEAQRRANTFAPACAAARLPAYGLFICSADPGAPWKEVVWALTGKHTPIAANKSADRDPMNADLLLFQRALLAAFKSPSRDWSICLNFLQFALSVLLPTRNILPLQSGRSKNSKVHAVRARFDRPPVSSCLRGECVTLNQTEAADRTRRPVLRCRFRVRHAVDYISAYPANSAERRFFRALSSQLCYSSFALNTSVVLCGLW